MSLKGHPRPGWPAASPAMSAMPPKRKLDRLHANAAIGVSYRDATGMNTMTAVTIDRPSDAKPVSRPRSRKPATVSASALTLHLDCARAYISKLEAEGVIQRQGDGFPLDQSRVAYLRYLRRERQQSPRAAADAEHALAKAALLRIRIEEKQRTLVRRDAVDETDRPDRWHRVDASVGHVGAVLARHGGQAQHRRGRDADQARRTNATSRRSTNNE